MYFSKIKKLTFGKNQVHKIEKYQHLNGIINKLYSFINTNYLKYNRVVSSADLKYIKQNNYSVAPLFNGHECFLFLCSIKEVDYCVVILKEDLRTSIENINYNFLKVYNIKLKFSNNAYKGTIFDGNLCTKKDITTLFINDILYSCGQDIIDSPLTKRLSEANKLINKSHKNKYFQLMINSHKPLDDIKTLYFDKIKNSHLDIKGLIFVNNDSYSHIYNLYNNQMHNKNLVGIFQMSKYNITDVYVLQCMKDNTLTKWGIALIPTMEKSHEYQKLFSSNNSLKMKCIYNTRFRKWEPVKIVNDKISDFDILTSKVQEII